MFAVIVGKSVVMHPDKPSLAQMQEAVGGYIETALRMPSPTRKGITVDAFVNEEGLCIGLPVSYVRSTDGSPLAGAIVITASSNRTGNTVPATQEEIDALRTHLRVLPTTLAEYDFEPQMEFITDHDALKKFFGE